MTVATQPEAGAASRFDRTDWTTVALIGGIVLFLHLFGWGVLVLLVAPQHITLGSAGVFGIGLGVTAYLLGVRHAFDADHIAVDRQHHPQAGRRGTRSLSAGFWFSLGHSSVVFGLALLLSLGVRALVGPVQDESSPMLQTLGLIGSLVAGTFLDPHRVDQPVRRRRHRQGVPPDAHRRVRRGRTRTSNSTSRGFLARLLGRFMRRVSKPWHLYPVGLLMGLGFDTATQWPCWCWQRGGGIHAAVVRHPRPARAVRGRDEPVRCARRHLHGARLRLGLPQAGPQGVLQPHRDPAVGGRRTDHRRHPAAPACWPTGLASRRARWPPSARRTSSSSAS